MNRKMSFTIFDKPIAWKRPGHRKGGGNYDEQKHEKLFIRTIVCQYLKQFPSIQETMFSGPISIDFKFYFKLPKSKAALKGKGLYKTTPSDLSNCIKFYEDAFEGILYENDSIIFKINAIKCYSDTQRTEVTIKEVPQEPVIPERTYEQQKNFVPARMP